MGDKTVIMVVDDNLPIAKTLHDILKIKGYEALEAHSGEEALEMVRTHTLDCVLMDINMPGISGIEALKIIKQIVPDLPVILMTAYATDEQIANARKDGAYSVLRKPVDISVFLITLAELEKGKRD